MSELNREQIVKALECCSNNDECVGEACPYYATGCEKNMPKDALSLIKELTEEIEQRIEDYSESQKKWETVYDKLEYTLEGVMHSVDKWLDGAELEQDEVNRAITMREKTLQIVERLTDENERLRAEGEWTYSEGKKTMKCTRCRLRMKTYDVRRFCPNCGAKMKGE